MVLNPSRGRLIAFILLATACPAARADLAVINFDTTPNLALAPSTFVNARQDLAVPGLATIVGGTPVGNPTFLASFGPGGGVRNAYGTRSGTSNGYLQNLTLNFDPLAIVTNVQGTLFNGYVEPVSYTVQAFNGVTLAASQSFTDVPEDLDPTGFRNWNLSASAITRLVITPDTTFTGGAWDYFIDNVRVTYTVVPEPASVLTMAIGLVGVATLARWRVTRRAA